MSLSRRHFFLGSLALPALAAKKPTPARPNLLLLLADELPAWMLGCYGNKQVRTRNIDRLSQTGTRFLNHFVAAPAAGPSRSTLLTGRTPMQLGEAGAISPSDITLDKILGGLGYVSQIADGAAAARFLDQQAAGKPFFLTVNLSSPQPPYDSVAQKYRDLYAHEQFEGYRADPPNPRAQRGKEMLADVIGNVRKCAAAITALDDEVAAVIAKLSQKQLLDNTLVVFTSTCGSLLGRHGLWDSGDASDPANMYDETAGAPLVWSWLGRVPAQAVQVELVSNYDFVPTICDIAGEEVPSRNLCGHSYLLLATGKPLPKKQTWRTSICSHYKNTDMARIERYKLVQRDGGKGPNEIYDLAVDPRERINQAENQQFVTVATSLAGEIAAWKRQYSS